MTWQLNRFGFKQMMECRGMIRALFADDPPTLTMSYTRAS